MMQDGQGNITVQHPTEPNLYHGSTDLIFQMSQFGFSFMEPEAVECKGTNKT